MTDVQNRFTSEPININSIVSTTTTNATLSLSPLTTPPKNGQAVALEANPTSPFVLRAPPSANSKLILQNMEEVLNSVKKKHREKHKRKREQKRRAAQLAEAEEVQKKKDEGHVQMDKKQPLREKSAQENGAIAKAKPARKSSPLKCSTPAPERESIRKHFMSMPVSKSQTPSSRAAIEPADFDEIPQTPKVSLHKPTNVFELMMNARTRSLGTNANGQELPLSSDKTDASETSTPQTKRKQMLQDWNDRKGGAKRKLADEARGEYIEHQMEQRTKRLKKMLTKPDQVKAAESQPSSAPTIGGVKRARGRPRTRRLSSLDTDKCLQDNNERHDAETEEFLAKLSSPTKKRDSLLGYFPKVVSPMELAEKQARPTKIDSQIVSLETPKRRTRGINNKAETPVIEKESEAAAETAPQTPSGRPRRSCAGKARYDYDLEKSPTKTKDVSLPVTSAPAADSSIEIIDLDNSNPPSTPKKLAPLFMRQLPKPSPDPEALRARHEFLRSGVPDKLKQEQQRQKQFEQYYEDSYELFPSIAHVPQLTAEEKEPNPREVLQLKLRFEDVIESTTVGKRKSRTSISLGGITSCTKLDFQGNRSVQPGRRHQAHHTAYSPLPALENKRDIVKLWKNEFKQFPTFKCYNQMRDKYRFFSVLDSAQDTQQVGESFVVTRSTRRSLGQQKNFDAMSSEEVKPPALAPNGELLFTEKYKPLMFEQVLVNLTPVQQLRDFLAQWNGAGQRNLQIADDVSFDFGNDSSSVGPTSNAMVILGPCSSGKTNAVFALANDMNFNVLEINAGMRRTGKKLIQELQEATQSHQIRKDIKSASSSTAKMQMSLNGLRNKRQKSDAGDSSSNNELSQSVRKSLILIEDADILFENTDAGFTDAIYTLAASSKRPVIVVASDPNCAHLQRLMQQNTVEFHAPNVINISKYLAVLALMENCPTQLDELISLYLYNGKNLRKTLMELQFYIQSGGDRRQHITSKCSSQSPPKVMRLSATEGLYLHEHIFEFYTCAQNAEHRIPFPVDFQLLRLNLNDLLHVSPRLQAQCPTSGNKSGPIVKRKSRSPKKAWLSSATHMIEPYTAPISTLSKFYKILSAATLVDARLDRRDRLQPHLTEEIAHTLVELSLKNNLGVEGGYYNLFDKPEKRHKLCSHLGNFQLRTTSARNLDYEPALRAICRSEKQRAATERRSSRFYHYLRNHTTNMCNFSTEPFDEACGVFEEDAQEQTNPTASETESS
ncbi:uncharacterized protein LOC115632715 isoform X2 [Scaptodrosophila lebanonensis]|uniref:Uncharacterized protein LOC115632715 isoform X2 n=1 Tax=Drosophila lebanonensis TaxID=7225 RepID=A0A6J2UCL2_DROLE|nr:uncharacterized protein LOC115632715 isoform X2 [Scaptodrosophila lebanonensis]XP_030385820.1 uncharacterized protein LOC115632715 isoform X2 [Scaptodrosophila lebanonensis]